MSLQWKHNRRSRWVWARQPASIGRRWLRHRNFVIRILFFTGSSVRYFSKPKVFSIIRYTVHLPPFVMPSCQFCMNWSCNLNLRIVIKWSGDYKQNCCVRQLFFCYSRHWPSIWWSRDASLHQTCIVTNIDLILWVQWAAQRGFYRLYRFYLT